MCKNAIFASKTCTECTDGMHSHQIPREMSPTEGQFKSPAAVVQRCVKQCVLCAVCCTYTPWSVLYGPALTFRPVLARWKA